MKENVIKVLKVAPHETPEVVYLENKLEVLQTAVSIGADYRGLIEIISLDCDTCILCNEEGKILNLEPNRRLGRDILCGVFYVTGQNEDGDLTSLPDHLIQQYSSYFATPDDISKDEVDEAMMFKFFIC